jgi:ABC-type polysaccharide/polyol phosphate transport system ATPase subunit
MPAIDVAAVRKAFAVPAVRRDTVREHALDFFRRRPVERLTVLEEVTFSIARGSSVALMGRNGSGKSTLLKILAGVYDADAGEVTIRGEVTPILELGIGFNGELDAVDNVFLLGTVMGMTLAGVRARLDGILRFAELEQFARLKVQHFSSGMAARLAYAVAFAAPREVLILDEIFAVGDVGFQARCRARYRELSAAGHTMLLVSHDLGHMPALCSRALLLERGRIVQDADAGTVARSYARMLEA